MSTRVSPAKRPKARPASDAGGADRRVTASSSRPSVSGSGAAAASARSGSESFLGQVSPRGRFGLAIIAAVLVGLVGLLIGLNIGRPNWPADGSADVGFARDMSSHHAQAVEMGMIAFQNATRDNIRSLGGDIAMTQKGQIGLMEGWLDTWGVPTNTTDPPMAWVPGGEAMLDGNRMPGMATRDEINQLINATGEQVDILFLQYMIRHHQGGIHMVDAVLAADPIQPVRELAEQMARTQGAEVILMRNLLRDLGASPLPR